MYDPVSRRICAWRRETRLSSSTRSLSAWRPMVNGVPATLISRVFPCASRTIRRGGLLDMEALEAGIAPQYINGCGRAEALSPYGSVSVCRSADLQVGILKA